jgi:hypothetical protein
MLLFGLAVSPDFSTAFFPCVFVADDPAALFKHYGEYV